MSNRTDATSGPRPAHARRRLLSIAYRVLGALSTTARQPLPPSLEGTQQQTAGTRPPRSPSPRMRATEARAAGDPRRHEFPPPPVRGLGRPRHETHRPRREWPPCRNAPCPQRRTRARPAAARDCRELVRRVRLPAGGRVPPHILPEVPKPPGGYGGRKPCRQAQWAARRPSGGPSTGRLSGKLPPGHRPAPPFEGGVDEAPSGAASARFTGLLKPFGLRHLREAR